MVRTHEQASQQSPSHLSLAFMMRSLLQSLILYLPSVRHKIVLSSHVNVVMFATTSCGNAE